jgi:hypothetical protein
MSKFASASSVVAVSRGRLASGSGVMEPMLINGIQVTILVKVPVPIPLSQPLDFGPALGRHTPSRAHD